MSYSTVMGRDADTVLFSLSVTVSVMIHIPEEARSDVCAV